MREALVVMALAPREGEVKTRLIGALTAPEAAELYTNFLSDTFVLMESIKEEREELSLILCYTGDEEAFENVEREGSMMISQRGGDLGERLHNCFVDLFALGFQSVVVLGADSPTLPGENIFDAFEVLADEESSDEDLALGPSQDGGYYLIGQRRPNAGLFEGLAQSADRALATIQQRAEEAGLNLFILPEWYKVDTTEELERLKQELDATRGAAKFTRKFLERIAKTK